jgi:EGF-like domain
MSGEVNGAGVQVVENSFVYPYGTTELYPAVQNSDLSALTDSAHYYMECSNKGTCDRSSGECSCYDGFEGAACQRTSCANSCSGHGVCKTIEDLAKADNKNVYKLWDRQSTMGCQCDKGYAGPDCSERHCKVGVDPLYFDDTATGTHTASTYSLPRTNPWVV